MKCNKDCFNCPFPDCINDSIKTFDAEYYNVKYKSKRNEKRKIVRAERKANGMCTECGKRKIAENSESMCTDCLLKHRNRSKENRRKKGILPRELFDGVNLCRLCGKSKPVDGYTECENCLEKHRQSIAIGRSMRKDDTFRKMIDGFWKEKKGNV